jgi:hypothetical protein
MGKKRYYNLLGLGFILSIAHIVIKVVYNPIWSFYSFIGLMLFFSLIHALRRKHLRLPHFYNFLSLKKVLHDFRRRMGL